jgi:hypothetical protein
VDDIEAIKQLKARYFRTTDTKDWDETRQVYADDVVVETTASGGTVIAGADDFMAFLRATLGDVVTVHHGHMPEIELTSSTTATGIWAMDDLLRWPHGDMRGFGHYHETYEKTGDTWRIKTSRLTRLRVDMPSQVATGSGRRRGERAGPPGSPRHPFGPLRPRGRRRRWPGRRPRPVGRGRRTGHGPAAPGRR